MKAVGPMSSPGNNGRANQMMYLLEGIADQLPEMNITFTVRAFSGGLGTQCADGAAELMRPLRIPAGPRQPVDWALGRSEGDDDQGCRVRRMWVFVFCRGTSDVAGPFRSQGNRS